ncbi:Ras-related protein Rab-19 [Tritrichomonas foetus]|uniref:Ras-related protein Rab-19 n=1 Tax=Tritrichomonas foetus TaxID=1144522 RepID=A0A1J4J8P9_9EUKA|nr:Ras-related protein Rab-19 [Tritrichomonas foetus]|eukprot:OHS95558.1 Ras-related protein Rab-19 [Tritrichomonas foetus]
MELKKLSYHFYGDRLLSHQMQESDLCVKVVLLGQSMVGKTCLVGREMDDVYLDDQKPTVGVSFVTKFINLDDFSIRLQIWDTAGEERFRSIAPMYYHDCGAAILVYSITDKSSFENIEVWINELKSHMEKMPLLYVVGNKCDLIEEREVKIEDVKNLCEKYKAEPLETSAKTGQGVSQLFQLIAKQAFMTNNIKKEDKPIPVEKKGCC